MRCSCSRLRCGTRGVPGAWPPRSRRDPRAVPRRGRTRPMDLTPYVGWIVYLHIAGAFTFVAGHGVSMFVAFQLRRERERARLGALLDLSGKSLGVAGIGLLVLFVSGIVAGIVLGSFGQWWIWISLALLVVISGLMTPVGGVYFSRIRLAIGQRTRNL